MTAQARGERDTDRGAGPVLEAAAALEVKEFDLFALAHLRWFCTRAETKALERVFAAYMFGGGVPPWARHDAREILREIHAGPADLARFGLERLGLERPRADARPRHARLVLAATLAVFALVHGIMLQTVLDPRGWTASPQDAAALSCQGGGPGLRHFESLAFAIAGRAPPSCRGSD